MKKWVLAVVIMLVALALLALAMVCHSARHEPAWVKLPNGNSVRIRAVTYGTNHIVGSDLSKVTAHLPVAVQNLLGRTLGQGAVPLQTMITPTPELVVWVEQESTNGAGAAAVGISASTFFHACLGDGSNFISGENTMISSLTSGSQIEPLRFHVFPRRNREITLNLFYHDANGKVSPCTRFSFPNPRFRQHPVWQAESLPATKRAAGVEITLLGLETGHDNSTTEFIRTDGVTEFSYGTNRLEGDNNTLIRLKLKPLANTNEVWQLAGLEIADATGNIADAQMMDWNGDPNDFEFRTSLWPDEAAWKLKLAVKRNKGFRPEELVVFKNVPLAAINHTDVITWMTNFNGVGITLQSICRRPPLPKEDAWDTTRMSDVKFSHNSLLAGMQLDLVEVLYDTGEKGHSDSYESFNDQCTYYFHEMPAKAQTADFVFALQKVQIVEFTARPEMPKPKLEGKKHDEVESQRDHE